MLTLKTDFYPKAHAGCNLAWLKDCDGEGSCMSVATRAGLASTHVIDMCAVVS